jgi:hypothetical protein
MDSKPLKRRPVIPTVRGLLDFVPSLVFRMEHNFSESGSVAALRLNGGEVTIKMFSNERANFSHWTTSD